jgi:3-oxosteroid 1-dehydrogenase
VRELVTEGERVAGVVVEREGKTVRVEAKRGVVLAAGGFARNGAMRARHQRAPIGTEWTAAAPEDKGDAIELGRGLGAALGWMDEGWWTPTTVVPGEALPWILVVEKSLPGAILVNQAGKRFTNEAAPYIEVVNGIYADHEKTGASVPAYLVMDARCRRKYPLGPVLPGGVLPEAFWKKRWRSGWIEKARTIGDLAAKLGVDRVGLEATVEAFNGHARAGKDPDFGRGDSAYDRYYADPRNKPNPSLAPLTRAPYYAIPVWPGDLGTKGGLVTDDDARVVREDGSVVEGLYATGNSSASIMARTYPGAGGTIGPAMTFGYLAALHAVPG